MNRREEGYLCHPQFAVHLVDAKREHWNLEKVIVQYVFNAVGLTHQQHALLLMKCTIL